MAKFNALFGVSPGATGDSESSFANTLGERAVSRGDAVGVDWRSASGRNWGRLVIAAPDEIDYLVILRSDTEAKMREAFV